MVKVTFDDSFMYAVIGGFDDFFNWSVKVVFEYLHFLVKVVSDDEFHELVRVDLVRFVFEKCIFQFIRVSSDVFYFLSVLLLLKCLSTSFKFSIFNLVLLVEILSYWGFVIFLVAPLEMLWLGSFLLIPLFYQLYLCFVEFGVGVVDSSMVVVCASQSMCKG